LNSLTSIGSFLRDNAWFATRYLLHLTIACFLGFASVKIMVDSIAPDQFLSREFPLFAQAIPSQVVAPDLNQEANLTPNQWQQIADLLKSLPPAIANVEIVHGAAATRLSYLLESSNFKYHFDSLPIEGKEDWRTLKKMEDWTSANIQLDDSTELGQDFNIRVLTASDIQRILDSRSKYEQECQQIDDSSNRIDRLVPLLSQPNMGLLNWEADPCDSLHAFMQAYEQPGADFKNAHTPDELPPIDFTFDQVVKQLTQSPLSSGSTSADRASSTPPAAGGH
jgi:hypothetical protein